MLAKDMIIYDEKKNAKIKLLGLTLLLLLLLLLL